MMEFTGLDWAVVVGYMVFDNLDWASHVGEPSQYQRLFLGREDLAVVVGEWLDDCD